MLNTVVSIAPFFRKGSLVNENLIAITVVAASLLAGYLGLDDGDLVKMVVSAFLGYLTGKRLESRKKG